MQFLNPVFLVGLAAAAIPIVLHFLSRRQVVDIPFAPLRFLVPTQERQMRRLNLRRLLLLLLRVAIIALIVMAMARPTITGGLAGLLRSGDGVSAVLLVDDSASMRAQMADGTAFDEARREVAAIAGEMDRGDEVAVLLYSDTVRPLFREFVRDPDLVVSQLDQVEPGFRGTDYVAALAGALEMLQRATHDHREIYLVGDFQRAAIDTVGLARVHARLGDTNIFLRAVGVEPFVNRQIVSVDRPPTLLRSGQTVDVVVGARHDGDAEVSLPMLLDVAGATLGETELQLPAGGLRRHTFPITLPEAGDLAGSARLRPDRFPPDDERYFVLSIGEKVPTLVIKGVEGGEGERDPLLFLLAALDPTEEAAGHFEIDVQLASQFDVESLAKQHVVIGSDLRDLGAARLAALTEYLEDGGTLLLLTGDPRVREYANEKLLPGWTDLRLGRFRGEEEVHERLTVLAPDHPVFVGFEPEEMQTLEEVRLRNFYRLPEDVGRPLLRFAGGGSAVTELAVGRGRVIVCGFHTSAIAGDLPYSPMFLPLIQRLTGYLATAGWGRFGRHFQVGQSISVEAPEGATAASLLTVARSDGTDVEASLDASKSPVRVEMGVAEVPGPYTFQLDGVPFARVAVNVPNEESDRVFLPAADLRVALAPADGSSFRALSGASTADAVREARQGVAIHRWFLALAFLLLIVEAILSRRVAPSGDPA